MFHKITNDSIWTGILKGDNTSLFLTLSWDEMAVLIQNLLFQDFPDVFEHLVKYIYRRKLIKPKF